MLSRLSYNYCQNSIIIQGTEYYKSLVDGGARLKIVQPLSYSG